MYGYYTLFRFLTTVRAHPYAGVRRGIMKSKLPKKSKHPSESIFIQMGVAFTVVAGIALLVYAMQHFLP